MVSLVSNPQGRVLSDEFPEAGAARREERADELHEVTCLYCYDVSSP